MQLIKSRFGIGSRSRSLFVSLLAGMMLFLASCGNAPQAQPPTYTPDMVQRLESYTNNIQGMRDRLGELNDLIQEKDWIYADNFIHGPLGTLRQDMSLFNRNLLPQDQRQGRELAREISRHLEAISLAAQNSDYAAATKNYREMLTDLDAFLDLLPNATES
ncbi:photosystem II protein PsbQ [Geitlerinema sp. P-1104]|uniref:photosystem II protein PsbQ n=1 Tax=Geitlerinema sp. P-1104 TaxID=2546230 RepID=UPI001476CE45|nr:photosystem II protein PsbQ [Geitlerinema sp. P-1104]NMG57748.1 photosystem II protein PsbQ [Geitlerinema sp. P-1104]